MKVCPNCGNQEDKNYCSQCRTTMVPLQQPQQKPKKNMLPVVFGGIAALMLLGFALLVALGVVPLGKNNVAEETPKKQEEPEKITITGKDSGYSEIEGGFSATFDDSEGFSLGEISGSNYENKFIGIGFKKPADWTFGNEDDLKQLNNMDEDYSLEEVQKLIAQTNVAYLMCAGDGLGTNININVEKVSAPQLANANITDIYENIMPMLEESMEAQGFTDVSYKIDSTVVDGKVVDTIEGVLTYNGTKMYQKAFMTKCDGYLANVAVTTVASDTTNNVMKNVYWIN